MQRTSVRILFVLAVLIAAFLLWRNQLVGWVSSYVVSAQTTPATIPATFADFVIPFEIANEHIFITARVNNSRPLQFMIDTGDKYTLVDIALAQELNLPLGGDIPIHGVGNQTVRGAFVKASSLTLPAFPGFAQPVALAIPLRNLTPRLGHDLDGLLGSDFLQQVIVEVDYLKRTICLHNKDKFHYAGPGESIPIHLSPAGHPVLQAAVTPTGGKEISADFELDIGASGALELHSPFVAEHHLPSPNTHTIPDLGSSGVGDFSTGEIGRTAAFRIGSYTLANPLTTFSHDTAGTMAGSVTQGNIGQQIASRFRLFFDYSHNRIIFEPNATLGSPFDQAFSGLYLEARGEHYTTFRALKIQADSPASAAGMQEGDLVTAIDGRPAAALGYDAILKVLHTNAKCILTIDRKGKSITVPLTPTPIL